MNNELKLLVIVVVLSLLGGFVTKCSAQSSEPYKLEGGQLMAELSSDILISIDDPYYNSTDKPYSIIIGLAGGTLYTGDKVIITLYDTDQKFYMTYGGKNVSFVSHDIEVPISAEELLSVARRGLGTIDINGMKFHFTKAQSVGSKKLANQALGI